VTPLIFVHGAGLQGNFWRYQTSFFADSVAIDLPGHGASPLDPLNDIRAYAEWMIGWAREIHPGPVVIAGHSMGSLIALEAAAELAPDGISVAVLNARFAKPLDENRILSLARRCKAVVTVEEGGGMGGFGSAVLEALSAGGVSVASRCLAVPDRVIEHGDPEKIRQALGLDAEGIARAVRDLVKRSAAEDC
jgi:deoxyxylulose-5-phosphate synthase